MGDFVKRRTKIPIGELLAAPSNPDAQKWVLCDGEGVPAATWPQLPGTSNGNWVSSSGPFSASTQTICYANNTWVIGGESATIYQSSDGGMTWTRRLDYSTAYNIVKIIRFAGLFIAFTNSATVVLTSPDGITWTPQTVAWGGAYLAHASDGHTLYVKVAATNAAFSTTDGLNWSSRTFSASVISNLVGFEFTNRLVFVATSGTATYVSTDHGANWSNGTVASRAWVAPVVFLTRMYLFAPSFQMYSTDGITWVEAANSQMISPRASAVATDRLVVTNTNYSTGALGNFSISTLDGAAWDFNYLEGSNTSFPGALASDGRKIIGIRSAASMAALTLFITSAYQGKPTPFYPRNNGLYTYMRAAT